MSPTQSHIHAVQRFEIPVHAQEIATLGLDILHRAYESPLESDTLSARTEHSSGMYRAYFEKRSLEHPLDYERLAVHMGESVLFITTDHRHVYGESTTPSDTAYSRHTVAFQNSKVELFRSGIRGLSDVVITENKEACHDATDRLLHTLAVLGLREVSEDASLLRAS